MKNKDYNIPFQNRKKGTSNEELASQLAQIVSVSVKQFGAKGDGVTDDATAIQNTINYAVTHRSLVFFPEGEYCISSTITIPGYVKLYGVSRTLSTLKATSNIVMLKLNGNSTTGVYFVDIEGVELNGNNIATVGVQFEYSRESFVKDVYIHNCVIGVKLTQAWSNGIHNSIIKNNTDKNLELNAQSNDISVIDCQLDGGGNYGVHITADSQMINLEGCVIQKSGKDGIRAEAGRAINIKSCYFELNNSSANANAHDINLLGTTTMIQGVNISGCMFWVNKTISAINNDNALGITVSSPVFLGVSGSTSLYGIQTSTNTRNVFISGEYKETLTHNDVGLAIMNISVPTFYKSGGVYGNYATWDASTPDATKAPAFTLTSAGKKITALTLSTRDFYLQHANNSDVIENIFRVPASNAMMQMYKPLDMNKNSIWNFVWEFGTTRPSTPTKGQCFYDDTLKKPIWYNGTNWTDSTGTTV